MAKSNGLSSRKIIPIFLGFVLLVVYVEPVPGQTAQGIQPELRTDLPSALRVVRPLIRDDPERAVQILKKLKQEYPGNAQVLVLLGESYRSIGDIEAAQESYEACLRFHPTHLQAGALLGLLHVQSQREAQAEAVFQGMLERSGYSVNAYRTIASTLSRFGYFDRALRFYKEGRHRNKSNYILSLDIAYLQKSMGNFEESLREYLFVVETAPGQHRLAKSRIVELMRDPDAGSAALLAILREDAEREAPHRAVVLEILSMAYLERGMLEGALDMAFLAEESEGSDGTVLFGLADQTVKEYERRSATERTRYFDLALRALEGYLDGYPESKQVPRAKLMLIELLVDLASGRVRGRPKIELSTAVERALDALDWLIASFPGTDYSEQAYLKKGDVVLRIQKRPMEAIGIYKTGMSSSRFYPTSFAERLGRVYLTTEEYDQAKAHFSKLVNSKNQELSETGVFYSGLLLSFTNDYESARDTLAGLAEANPSSQFANDAIELAWAIEEGLKGEQKILHGYMKALRHELAGDTTAVIAELGAIVSQPKEIPLRGRAVIKLGEMYQGMEKYTEAVHTFERFLREYPKDILLPDVHRKIGQVYEVGFGNRPMALEKYENILILFPHYIFLDDVRADVTRLRAEIRENI